MIVAAVLLAVLERLSTHCQTRSVTLNNTVDQELVGCGESFTENTLWNLDRADNVLDGFATRATRGKGAVVYVIDTGVEGSHDEFQRDGGRNVLGGLDPVVELSTGVRCPGDSATHPCFDEHTLPIFTHGTAVASVVAGRTTGVAPDASIVSVRVQADVSLAGLSDNAPYLRALDDIVHHAFDPSTPQFSTAIVNMSASPNVTSPSDPFWLDLQQKMNLMIGGVNAAFHADPNGKRFLFVVTAGNNNGGASQCTSANAPRYYPGAAGGSIDGLITVGGIDRENRIWAGSCTGDAVDIYAPAERILCASISAHNRYRGSAGTFDVSSGTSYAAPYVCGIAARMLESDPTLSPVALEQRIKAASSPIAGGRAAVMVDAPALRRRATGR